MDDDNVVRLRRGFDLTQGGGGGTIDERVTRLETHFEYIQRDLHDIAADQKSIDRRLSVVPTISNLWTMIATVIGTAFAMIAVVIGVVALIK